MTKAKPEISSILTFARHFFGDPLRTGSLVPSSPFLVNRMLQGVEWEKARVIVELGPGLGCMTKEILGRMRGDAALVVFELNPEFAETLRCDVRDARLTVLCASADQVDAELPRLGYLHADYIVSSLPFATMPKTTRRTILAKSHQMLAPKGRFILFQYRRFLLPVLREIFCTIECAYEFNNFPPAHVFSCTK